MTDFVALAEEGKEPDSLDKIIEDIEGALIPHIRAAMPTPTPEQHGAIMDELEELYARWYAVRKDSANVN